MSFADPRKAAEMRVGKLETRTPAAVRAHEMAISREMTRIREARREEIESEAAFGRRWLAKNKRPTEAEKNAAAETANNGLKKPKAKRPTRTLADAKQAEAVRYIAALNHRLVDKARARGVELPALCSCRKSSGGVPQWERCAVNCPFYKNPQLYARSLQDLYSCFES